MHNNTDSLTTVEEPNDESIETCGANVVSEHGTISGSGNGVGGLASVVGSAGWAGAGLGAALAVLLGFLCLITVCKLCRQRTTSRDIHVSY